jgi:hypothetical protein
MIDKLTLYAFKMYFAHHMCRIRHLVVSCSIFNGPLLRKARPAGKVYSDTCVKKSTLFTNYEFLLF